MDSSASRSLTMSKSSACSDAVSPTVARFRMSSALRALLRVLTDSNASSTYPIALWAVKRKPMIRRPSLRFVYLTSTSSPFENWMRAIPGIPGDHYYLTEEQDKYLSGHLFGSTGVPKYAIYDTAGRQLYTQVGWGGLEKIQTAIEKALN